MSSRNAREGSCEIEANNRRLASTKKTVELTERNLKAAENALAVAKKEYEAARDDMEDAQACFDASRKKWEGCGIEDEDRALAESAGSKLGSGVSRAKDTNANDERQRSHEPEEQVVVEGSGIPEINGIYNRRGSNGGLPVYFKKAKWKGKKVEFHIYGNTVGEEVDWFILILGDAFFYYANSNETVPPEDGWDIVEDGVLPPPKISLKL